MGKVQALLQQVAALRSAQQMEAALAAATDAVRLAPADAQAAFAFAQLSFETWRPAAEAFARARSLSPAHPELVRNHALALAAEGERAAAEHLLEATLAQEPRWLDGHRTLAAMRITHGETAGVGELKAGDVGHGFDRSYAAACAAFPGHTSLWLAWFQQHATLKRWSEARRILEAAKEAYAGHSPEGRVGGTSMDLAGDLPRSLPRELPRDLPRTLPQALPRDLPRGLALAEIFLEAETGELGDAEREDARFRPFAALQDPGLDICQVRHWLRTGDPARAAAVAERHLGGSAARLFWPYASLAWRLLGDARAEWLDGSPLYSTAVDLPFTALELAELAEVLRGLHRLRAPYPEQSVRGGTQTDRQLFFHPHPVIQQVRAKVATAVAQFASRLPVPSIPRLPPLQPGSSAPSMPASPTFPFPQHPLLANARPSAEHLQFEGSWSVRLAGAGFHASHTHQMGWISSALYVALPAPEDMREAPAGWLGLGTPPPELGLPLQPYRHVEPKPGRLALFPSTLWHSTEPFGAGERLTIAFDVRQPVL